MHSKWRRVFQSLEAAKKYEFAHNSTIRYKKGDAFRKLGRANHLVVFDPCGITRISRRRWMGRKAKYHSSDIGNKLAAMLSGAGYRKSIGHERGNLGVA